MTDHEPAGECDPCGRMVPISQLSNVIAYGIETRACCQCRGVEPDEDEEPNFDCGVCGGSGGGPDQWGCPACGGRGINVRARKAYYEDQRGDERYDARRDEGRA